MENKKSGSNRTKIGLMIVLFVCLLGWGWHLNGKVESLHPESKRNIHIQQQSHHQEQGQQRYQPVPFKPREYIRIIPLNLDDR